MEFISGFIIVLLLGCLITAGVIIRNLIIQNSLYEEWVINLSNRVEKTHDEMQMLDERDMFESDDEVGIIFREIKELIDELYEKMGEEDESEDFKEISEK
jgi:hypothetical protein